MLCIQKEFVKTDAEGVKWWKCILTSDTDPVSLDISGADVDDLADAIGIAAGSILLTPDSNYIAFEDGVFTLKSSSGGGGGGGSDNEGIAMIEFSPVFDFNGATFGGVSVDGMPITLGWVKENQINPWNGEAFVIDATDTLSGTYEMTVTPTSGFYAISMSGAVSENPGDPITVETTAVNGSLEFPLVGVAANNDPDESTDGFAFGMVCEHRIIKEAS